MLNFLDETGLARFFTDISSVFAALSHTHGTADIEDGAITTAKLANGAVTSSKIGNKAVANGNLGDMSVQTGKIFPKAVTTDKIADEAVTATQIKDATITESKLDAALAAKVNASSGGATVLYETTNPTQLDKSSSGTSSITLTTALTAADPQAVIVWVSTNDYDAPKIPIVIPRPDSGWTSSSYAGAQIWANATDFGYSAGLGSAQNLFKVTLLGNSDYISLSAIDAYVPGLDIWSDGQGGYTGNIDWSTSLSTYTPRIYIWKVVGV